ncbi:hypothetical protein KSP39_PZI008133 [Platanthera zijinensis]|uniref:procollagen-proline 4-dioxygenase n=1 Tax=Platanthera zijinensis TaxID=2320716 RepID=A0AAP0G8D1_9ASPA
MARGSRHHRFFSSRKPSSYTLLFTVLLLLSVVLLMLLGLGIFSLPIDSGDSPKATRRADREISAADGMLKGRKQWTEILSWEPRAFIYHNFLSKEECEYLIELAKPHMAKSTVVDSTTGKSKDSRVRTSSGMFVKRGRDKIVRAIEKRIADFSFIPVGQKYEPHYDYFLDEFNTKNGGQRIATILMYLSDVEEGGETVFPAAKVNSSSLPWYHELSECGKKGLSVKPKHGDALLFWSMKPDATLDPSSLHGGCPVIKGNKWSSTKWMHVNEYHSNVLRMRRGQVLRRSNIGDVMSGTRIHNPSRTNGEAGETFIGDGGSGGNRGRRAAERALEMLELMTNLVKDSTRGRGVGGSNRGQRTRRTTMLAIARSFKVPVLAAEGTLRLQPATPASSPRVKIRNHGDKQWLGEKNNEQKRGRTVTV